MNWTNLWMRIFGATEWLGLDVGFWVSMAVVTLLVVIMNVVFWAMKPKTPPTEDGHKPRRNKKSAL